MAEYILNTRKDVKNLDFKSILLSSDIRSKITFKVDYKILRYFIKYNLKAYDYLPIWKQEKRNDTIDKLFK